jgi:hypothetical protein
MERFLMVFLSTEPLIILVNGFLCLGQYPGPTIEADWGDTLRKMMRSADSL